MTAGEFLGYRRDNGLVGCRNHVLVLAAMDSANPAVRRIAAMVPAVRAITIPYGRGQYGEDGAQTLRVLRGLVCHPNVGACVVVSLEPVSAGKIAEAAAAAGKPVETVAIQQNTDALRASYEGARVAAQLLRSTSRIRREPVPLAELVLGTECGGSDTTSGLAANPVAGWVADRLIEIGGSVCFSETSEILGAEHVLAARARNTDVERELYRIVEAVETEANRRGVDIRGANPVPDNIRGGLTTIEEKSLGAIRKGGTTQVYGVLGYAEPIPRSSGLYVMDTPAPAAESLTGLVAGGCQLIIFTTGVGNTLGAKLAPTIKLTGNPRTAEQMSLAIDVDVSAVMNGDSSLADAGADAYRALVDVAEGTLTASEVLAEEELAISRIGTTI